MAIVLTKEQQLKTISSLKGKNTKPEMLVRSLMHRYDCRYEKVKPSTKAEFRETKSVRLAPLQFF